MNASMKSLVRILRRVPLALAAICALVTFVSVASAAAQTGSGYSVTYVALQCTSYDQIYANRARNDIQESLEDLGPDSQYPNGQSFLVNPDAESQPPQDGCMPIVGWQFTLGTGYQTRAVTGPWGSLSKVTTPYDTHITTQDSTPLLNQNGDQIGDETIPAPSPSS